MNTQNIYTVNPSVILPFEAVLSLKVPTTELAPDFVPSVWVIVGEFATFEKAKAAMRKHHSLLSINHPTKGN